MDTRTRIMGILCMSATCASVIGRSLQENIEDHVPNSHSEEDQQQPQGYGNYESNIHDSDTGTYKLLDNTFGERIHIQKSDFVFDDKDEKFEHGANISHSKIKKVNINLRTQIENLPTISDIDLNVSESEINTIFKCPNGEILDSLGICTKPELTKNIYVYGPPPKEMINRLNFSAPNPEIQYNIIVVKTPPEKVKTSDPIIEAAPKQKTIVYVLQKKKKNTQKKIIKAPSPPRHAPEVFYGSYGNEEESNLSNSQFHKHISNDTFKDNHREDATERKTGSANKLISPESEVVFGAKTDKGGAFSWYADFSVK